MNKLIQDASDNIEYYESIINKHFKNRVDPDINLVLNDDLQSLNAKIQFYS
jgi:hypothetical protein